MTQIAEFGGPERAAATPQLRDAWHNPGDLRLLSYAPETLSAGAPLVVILHGCGQSAEAFARAAGWLALADALGFAVLCPEQRRSNNMNTCFNWFLPEDVRRDSGEAASIAEMTRLMLEQHALDPARVFVVGHSAGAAMANAMLASYPEIYAAGALVAGLPYGVARSMHEALAAMRRGAGGEPESLAESVRSASAHRGRWPKVSIWHGEADSVVAPANAGQIVRQWADVHQLSAAPPVLESFGARRRTRWMDGRGEAVLELNLIAGAGHDWAAGANGRGAPEADEITISAEILSFWGIEGVRDRAAPAQIVVPARSPRRRDSIKPAPVRSIAPPRPPTLDADEAAIPKRGVLARLGGALKRLFHR